MIFSGTFCVIVVEVFPFFIFCRKVVWWYKYRLPDTHTPFLTACAIPLAGLVLTLCLSRVTLTPLCHSHLLSQLLSQCLYVAVLRCKISCLRGWSSQWRLPQGQAQSDNFLLYDLYCFNHCHKVLNNVQSF